mgnify:CR=1 FL=1
MNVSHHPHDDLLMSHAAGALSESWSLAVATHLSFCPKCRASVQLAETLGGVLLAEIPDQELSPDMLEKVFENIESESPETTTPGQFSTVEEYDTKKSIIPPVLSQYVNHDVDNIPWKYIGPGVYQHMLDLSDEGGIARLLRIKAGKPIPDHGHRGREVTMVLSGCYSDQISSFNAGDMQDVDEEIIHKPIVGEEEECICLVVTDAPLIFQNWLPKVFQPIMKI